MTYSRQQRQKARGQGASITILQMPDNERIFLKNGEDFWAQARELFDDPDTVLISAFRTRDPIGFLETCLQGSKLSA